MTILTSDVTVNNLIIDGIGGSNLHGINIYVANHVVLNNVKTINNGRSGIVANGSTVTVNNITTANNGWSGIDVDLGRNVTSPAVLTVTGHSSQAETAVPQIKIDDTRKAATVVDQNNQYDVVNFENVRVYMIKPAPVSAPANLRLKNTNGEFACGGYTNINNITPTWDAVVGAASYNYRVTTPSGSTFGPLNVGNVTSISGPFGGEGYSTFSVQTIGTNGLNSIWSDPCGVTYDATSPTTPTSGMPDKTFSTTNDFYFTWAKSTDSSLLTYEFQSSTTNAKVSNGSLLGAWNSIADGNSEQNHLTSPQIHSTGAPDGTYFWQVRATDAAGNSSAWTTPWQMTIDTHAPATPTNLQLFDNQNKAITSGFTSSYDVTFKWGGSADTEHYIYKYWTDATGSPYSSQALAYTVDNVTSTSLSGVFNQGEGTHYLTVAACDNAGNCSTYATPTVVTYDHTSPVVSLSAPTSSLLRGTVMIDGTITDVNPDHYYLVIKNAANNVVAGPGTVSAALFSPWAWNTKLVADGTYTIDLEARDKAGNKGPTSTATMQVTVDNTAPVVNDTFNINMLVGGKTILAPVVTDGASATYAWTVSDPQLLKAPHDTLDQLTLTIGPAPKGNYTATLTVTDPAGNATTVVYKVTISTPASVLSANTGAGNGSAATIVAKTVSKNESNPLVLGDSIVAFEPVTTVTPTPEAVQNNNGRVQGDNTSNIKTAASSQNFLGLGWWWLPILFIVFGSMWFTFVSLRHKFTR